MSSYISTRAPLILFTLFILLSNIACAEFNPRHTPGFPDVFPENIEELLNYLRSILGGTSSETSELLNLLEHGDLEAVVESIKNEYPRAVLRDAMDLYARGELTNEALYEYLILLREWYEQSSMTGTNSTIEDFLLALRALDLLSEKAGYHDFSKYVDLLINDTLRSLMNEGTTTSEVGPPSMRDLDLELGTFKPPELSPPSNLEVPELRLPEPSFGSPSGGLPGLAAPNMPSLGIPSIRFDWASLWWIFIPLALAALAIALIKWGFRGIHLFTKTGLLRQYFTVTRSRTRLGEEPLPPAIKLYWLAVDHVSRRYGVSREPCTTHREFLDKARQVTESWSLGLLSQLTGIYELVRYGGIHNPSLDEQAERAYRSMVERD